VVDNKIRFNNKSEQEIFDMFISQISTNLNLPPLIEMVTVAIGTEEEFEPQLVSPRGLVRLEKTNDKSIILRVSPNYPEFIPFLLLREAYLCFLNDSLRDNVQILFLIYMLIELDLPRAKSIEDWKEQIRKIDAFSPYLSYQFETGNRLFQFKFPNSEKSIISILFHYFRNLNIDIPQGYFYPHLTRIYINVLKQAYQENEDLLETIRILDIIFNEVKSYRALLDYREYFKQFKEDGKLKTSLSLRKFIANLRWISRYSFCSPIYLLDWNTIGLSFFYFHVRFHPRLPWYKIKMFLGNLPFNITSQILLSGFSREYFGFIITPHIYIDDLKRLFSNLLESGFLVIADMFLISKLKYIFNLNYLSASIDGQKFVKTRSRTYREEFLLESNHEYTEKCLMTELELLDFLILERARQVSFTGFGFERRESTLSTLKDDYLTELSKQRMLINSLRLVLKKVSQSEELRSICLKFIKKNHKYGFFTLYEHISQIKLIMNQLRNLMQKSKRPFTSLNFLKYIDEFGLFADLELNLILKDPLIKKFLIQNLFPLYQNDRKRYNTEENIYNTLLTILSICKDLKLFDLTSIKNIIKDPEVFESLYKKKEIRIEEIYSQSLLKNITSNEVESRLEKFVSTSPPIISPFLVNSLITLTANKNRFLIILRSEPEVINKLREIAKKFPTLIYYEIQEPLSQKRFLYCLLNLPYIDFYEQQEMIASFHSLFNQEIISCNSVISSGVTPTITRRNFYDFMSKQFFYTPSLVEHFILYVRSLFGDNLPQLEEKIKNVPLKSLFVSTNLSEIIKSINKNKEEENLVYNQLEKLDGIICEIEQDFINEDAWTNLKKNFIYTHFIKSVKFQPSFISYRLQKYHVYFRPIDVSDVDFRLLLSNSFLSFQFNEVSKTSYSFMINYIFPKNNPNLSYLNWLMLSKKNISEYCLFSFKVEHIYQNFLRNIDIEDGHVKWNLDISQFINHVEKVLFSNKSSHLEGKYKQRIYNKQEKDQEFDPKDPKFIMLTSIYPHLKNNLKFLGSLPKDEKIYTKIKTLLKQKMGHLNINTNNLQLHQKVVFILPSIKKSSIPPILEIFRFFNKVKLYEIEGEYYLHSFLKVRPFEQGLCIKVWFPDIDIDNFIEYFSEIFNYFDITHVFICTGFYNGDHFLNQVYKGIDFNTDYNPLQNFEWNPIDKIWMAPKLFTEEFEPIYPPLAPKLDNRKIDHIKENSDD